MGTVYTYDYKQKAYVKKEVEDYNGIATTRKKIIDSKTSNYFGILMMNQENIESIRTKSGILANSNEYQVHYHMLVARVKFPFEDSVEVLDIGIPTVYFNYAQKVNSAAIDFNIVDVTNVSNATKPIATMIQNQLFATENSLGSKIAAYFKNNEISWEAHEYSNIHRHPGKLHSFSGTDLSTDPNDPGICFPLSKANGSPIFSSIITHQNKTVTTLGHTEYRIAVGDLIDGNEIAYYRGKSITLVKQDTPKPMSPLKTLLGLSNSDKVLTVKDGLPISAVVEDLMKILAESDYSANTDLVIDTNVEAKTYVNAYGYYYGNGGWPYGKKQEAVTEDGTPPVVIGNPQKELPTISRSQIIRKQDTRKSKAQMRLDDLKDSTEWDNYWNDSYWPD